MAVMGALESIRSGVTTQPHRRSRQGRAADLERGGDLTQFQNFLHMLAARSAQLLSLSDIAHHLGTALNPSRRGFRYSRPAFRSWWYVLTTPISGRGW